MIGEEKTRQVCMCYGGAIAEVHPLHTAFFKTVQQNTV